MAQMSFTFEEAVQILKDNAEFPPQIVDLSAGEGEIYAVIKPAPIGPTINATITFEKFENDKVYLSIKTNRALDGIGKLVSGLISGFIPGNLADKITINYPNIEIKVNRLLSKKVRGVQVREITKEKDRIIVRI